MSRHILIITNTLEGGSGWGRYSRDLVRELAASGLMVTVLCHEITSGVDGVKQIRCLPGPLQWNRAYALSWVYALTAALRLRRTRGTVHCLVEPYAMIALTLSFVLRAKLFVTCHGTYAVRTLSGRYAVLQRIAYRMSDRIVCVSRYTERRLLALAPQAYTVVIPNGLGNDFAHQKHEKARKNVIMSVGAVKKRKGYHVTLEALALVKQSVPDAILRIVGNTSDAAYVARLRERIEQLGLSESIEWYENISDEELAALYESSKVFVLPSINVGDSFEGFGLVYLEANAYGLPAIGSMETGAEDAIEDGVSGYLVHQQNVSEIAWKVIDLLAEAEKWKTMSDFARSRARAMQWIMTVKRYLALY